MDQSINQPTGRSNQIHQPIDRSTNQPTVRYMDQPMNHSIGRIVHESSKVPVHRGRKEKQTGTKRRRERGGSAKEEETQFAYSLSAPLLNPRPLSPVEYLTALHALCVRSLPGRRQPNALFPGIVGMRRSMVIRLRPCMI